MRKEARTTFGSLSLIITVVLAVLRFPADAAGIAATWADFELSVSPEVTRMLLIAAFGLLAAWALSPGLGMLAAARWQGWRRKRQRAEAMRRRQRDIRDYVTAAHEGVRAAVAVLIDGPREVTAGVATELLVKAGVIEVVGQTMRQEKAHTIYRLTEVARPVVEEIATPSATLPPTKSGS